MQLPYLDSLIDKHIENSLILDSSIDNNKIKTLSRKPDRTSSCWIHSLLVEDRDDFKSYMKNNGIHVDVAHVSNLKYSVFKRFKIEELPGLKQFDEHLINIPCGWWLSPDDISFIIKNINSYK